MVIRGSARPNLPVRTNAHTWRIVARYGSPIVPHTFVSARCNWTYDGGKMKLVRAELAAIRLVPGGTGDSFIDTLSRWDERAKADKPAGVTVIADLTRSLEMRANIARKVPRVAFVEIKNNQEDEWRYPARLCGRSLVLSRLMSWLTDRKLSTALHEPEDDGQADPNLWGHRQFERALSSMQARPPRPDSDDIIDAPTVEDEVILTVAQVAWWGNTGRPSIHAPFEGGLDVGGISSRDREKMLARMR